MSSLNACWTLFTLISLSKSNFPSSHDKPSTWNIIITVLIFEAKVKIIPTLVVTPHPLFALVIIHSVLTIIHSERTIFISPEYKKPMWHKKPKHVLIHSLSLIELCNYNYSPMILSTSVIKLIIYAFSSS